MIGTIRKHSKLLWGIVVPALIISLFMFFLPQKGLNGGGRAGADILITYAAMDVARWLKS